MEKWLLHNKKWHDCETLVSLKRQPSKKFVKVGTEWLYYSSHFYVGDWTVTFMCIFVILT